MSDFITHLITAHPGIVLAVCGSIIAVVTGYAVLRYKVGQNCKAVKKNDEKLRDITENQLPYCMTFADHERMCQRVNEPILSRLNKMDESRERTKSSRDKEIGHITETLGHMSGQLEILVSNHNGT